MEVARVEREACVLHCRAMLNKMSQPQCYRFSFRVTSNKTTPVKPLFTAETQRDVDSATLGNKGDIRRSLERRSESSKIERSGRFVESFPKILSHQDNVKLSERFKPEASRWIVVKGREHETVAEYENHDTPR